MQWNGWKRWVRAEGPVATVGYKCRTAPYAAVCGHPNIINLVGAYVVNVVAASAQTAGVYLTDLQARGYVEVCKGEVEKAEQAAKDADVVRDTKVEQAKDVAKVGEGEGSSQGAGDSWSGRTRGKGQGSTAANRATDSNT
jgi:hypothetical protein